MSKEEYIKLELPLPISVNKAYAWYRVRYKSNEYKQWIRQAELEMLKQTRYTITWDNWLYVHYEFLMPCYYKNGKKKVVDVANFEKVLSDFLTKNIEWFKDEHIKRILLSKTDSNENKVIILIKEI